MQPAKVLICDDSAMIRVMLRRMIEKDRGLRVVSIARNGEEALDKAIRLRPDVITMDIHMPVMDGLTALREIVRRRIAPVIMISSVTMEGAEATMEAMEIGAFDYIAKPGPDRGFAQDSNLILDKIRKAVSSDIYRKIEGPSMKKNLESSPEVGPLPEPVSLEGRKKRFSDIGFKAIALGMSTGGPKSVFKVLPALPGDLEAAVFVVQHMPPAFIKVFARRIDSKTSLRCVESRGGMRVEKGTIYVGRGGYHLGLRRVSGGEVMIRQKDSPKSVFMPSVDEMMISVSDVFLADTIGVVMTGMGKDGSRGIVHVAQNHGVTIAESRDTAIVYGMPREAVKTGQVQVVCPNWKIPQEILKHVLGGDHGQTHVQ